MMFEEEISQDLLDGSNCIEVVPGSRPAGEISKGNRVLYAKLMKAGEEERRRIREQLNRQKKRQIQMFLQDVNQKRGSFMLGKKKLFKEDLRKDILEGKTRGDGNNTKREELFTMSDD